MIRAGFTYRLSRLKLRASEKMEGLLENRGLITNNEDFFLVFTNIFSENATSADMGPFFGLHRLLVEKMEIA